MGLDRKRKSIGNLPKAEKKRKSIKEKTPPPILSSSSSSSSSEDSDDQSDHNNGIINEVKSENPVINRWPQNDVQKLLSQIEMVLPKNDNTTFRSRLPKIDWEKIQFDNYSKEECQSTWLAIQDQLKTFKTLGDLVHDAKNLLATKGIDTYQSKQNRVQKPRTAYMLFYMDILQKCKKKHPSLKLPQLTQIIAEKYNKLSPEKKQLYTDKAQKLKAEYIELVSKTNSGFQPNKAVKPKSPFQIFIESKSSGMDVQIDKANLQKHFKEKWDNMTEKKKSKWIKLAKEREETYVTNLMEDHKNDPAFNMPTKSALTKSDRELLDSQLGKPKKPPVNNYSLFSIEMLKSDLFTGVPPKEKMALIANKWKSFSNEEKQSYTDRLKVITEQYKVDYDAFLQKLPEGEKQIELAKTKTKPKKVEPKVVPRINAREGITEKPKKKAASKYNSKTKLFLNEPIPVPFKNSFELYKSKVGPNEKHPIKSLEEWTKKSGKKQILFDNELKALKKGYMNNLKIFLKSLSEEDLKLYLKLRKPELVTGDISDDKSSASEKEADSSSGEEDNDDNDNDDDDDDDDDDE
ncbi:High mobility group box domain [Cinara cedri]|uniref:High mobility group box domain n=1 Tax=Cinara cedri TaxID=506608 RepID=A0A5E4MNQ5_9HEMI|nr:High mobility group box domain [Cinara cedri]